MDDERILEKINGLAAEKERLYEQAGGGGGLDQSQTHRLREIELQLDQTYDLLAQRRARRAAGMDPDDTAVRPIEEIEGYEQ